MVTWGQYVQDRAEGCIIFNLPVSEIQEVCQIPVERPSIQVLLQLLWAFFSCSGFYKAIKSCYLSLEKAQCKNNNLPRRHATNSIFIRGLIKGNRYTDNHTSTLRVYDQYQKSYQDPTSTLEFLGMIVDSGEMTLSLLKETFRAFLDYRHLQNQQIQKLICQNSFKEKVETSAEARKELL